MKASYKLLGAVWDGMPKCDEKIPTCVYDPTVRKLGEPHSLFDVSWCCRAASLSDFFKLESEDAVDAYLHSTFPYDELQVVNDCTCLVHNPTIQRFVEHRASQVIACVLRLLPGVCVRIAVPGLGGGDDWQS